MKEPLQKLISRAGVASRRKAEALIEAGQVTVNGKRITEQGVKADPASDHIKVNGRLINPLLTEARVYILLNKPRGVLSTVSDPENRKKVIDLVPQKFGRLFPVGRLDFNTEGLIILTNDGGFAQKISSSKSVPKMYQVKVKGIPRDADIQKLRRGLTLADGFRTAPAEIKSLRTTGKNAWFEITLFEGHNKQIRKMFDAIGFTVVKLKRSKIGNVGDELLKPGQFRELTEKEVSDLKRFKRSDAARPKAGSGVRP